jgi:thiol-disulfide isomerase/thioredoxin
MKHLIFASFTLFLLWGWRYASDPLPVTLPSINFYNLSGDTINSDSLKGKVVFVNFWASWSINSRKLNRAQLSLYEKYRHKSIRKDMSIVFISISLDTRSELHKAAIGQDDLHWPNNVCDYKGWASNYVTAFNVKSLPSNYIFGPDGKLIGHNVWGNRLDSLLEKQYAMVSK